MKRTAEIILSVIGAVLNGLAAILVIFMTMTMKSQSFIDEMEAQMKSGATIREADFQTVLHTIQALGWGIAVVLIIGTVIGIVAAVQLRNNKRPKLSGILLIIDALLVFFFTVGFGVLPALLYLIAGILSLVRKPPIIVE
ncbi:MAG: DUF4064 domain-containing protein [Heyndrickxia coagulans]|mgnify:CR=1 FL=1|jgi:hypothetical protein|uniref:DUF4064 domain-containing protein n=1 Tax=Heyndrickxia coagulans TaxID=1398 RepID=A0A150K158_HEYCO|nr:DUF4064 domain-containing protein [Heyndrickxia coagulans]KYC63310.1 hypothetical protein B4098_0654 [Heyndrickxia coagulans]